jgi:hypothetical protein
LLSFIMIVLNISILINFGMKRKSLKEDHN